MSKPVLHREEKQVIIGRSYIANLPELIGLAVRHRVHVLHHESEDLVIVLLTESSYELPTFARDVAKRKLLVAMPEATLRAVLADLTTLECP